jgi:hypothetical protein
MLGRISDAEQPNGPTPYRRTELARDSFRTADGARVPAVTSDQMREIDCVAVEEVGLEK